MELMINRNGNQKRTIDKLVPKDFFVILGGLKNQEKLMQIVKFMVFIFSSRIKDNLRPLTNSL